MYAAYSIIVVLLAWMTLPSKGADGLPMVVVWLAILYAPILLYRPSFRVFYSTKEAEVFRTEIPKTEGTKSEISKMTYQTTVMPVYKDVARTQRVGRFYSSAEIFAIDSEKQNDVMQTVTFTFDGHEVDFPKGSVTVMIDFKNDIHHIFPDNNVYRGNFFNGLLAYSGMRGVVDVTVTDDQREAVFFH